MVLSSSIQAGDRFLYKKIILQAHTTGKTCVGEKIFPKTETLDLGFNIEPSDDRIN